MKSARAIPRQMLLLALVLSAPGCSGTSVQPGPPSPSEPVTTATLSFDAAQIGVHTSADGIRRYFARFLLRETGGSSGATIQQVAVPGETTGPSCWLTPLRVPPGGTLDTFYTIEGQAWLSYCAIGWYQTNPGALAITVTYTDDNGRSGSITTVARQVG